MAEGDLSRLKIAKKTYVFDTRRKYTASKSFMQKKKAETPAEELKEKLKQMLSRKPTLGSEKEGKKPSEKSPEPTPYSSPLSSTTRMLLIVMGVVLGFIILGGVYIGFVLGTAPPEPQKIPMPDIFEGSFASKVTDSEVISYAKNDRVSRSAYLLVDYSSANLSQLNFTAELFLQRPASQAFLLDYARDSADNYPVFRKKLFEGMQKQGISINEIDMAHLPMLQGGAVVVVPTGYLPKELVGMGSEFSYRDLLARGVTIVYIGRPFDGTVIDSSRTTIPTTADSGIAFNKFTRTRLDSQDGFRLFDAQYNAAPSATGQGLSSGGQIYGSVSVIKKGPGSLLLLPQSLDGGWGVEGGEAAAQDVVRLIKEERWLPPIASAHSGAKLEEGAKRLSLFTTPFDSEGAFVKFSAVGTDGKGAQRRTSTVFQISKEAKGEMTPRDLNILPFYLSSQRNRLNIQLKENDSTLAKLFIRMYKDATLLQEEELELGLTNPTTEKTNDFPVNAEPGSYVVRVEDASNKVYASCQLDVADIQVDMVSSDWPKGKFTISLYSEYGAVNPKSLTLTFDGSSTSRFTPSQEDFKDGKTMVEYTVGGEIKPGNHTIMLYAGDSWKRKIPMVYKPPKNFWDNPLVLLLGLMSAAVFAVGLILRKPEILRYGLDIPDFPPLSTIKIPVKTQTVLEIFDTVNASYSWQWMPLRLDELKNGFRRLTYNGKPILIGDFNLERVLAKLKEQKLVKNELGYWGLCSWEKDSGHTIRYLTIYRIMRNVLVNNAVRFSKLDAMPDCDVKALTGKDEIYFHIMEAPYEPLVHKALATSKKGTTIMIFATDDEVEEFRRSLTSTSKLAVGLKMELNAGSIHMMPVKNAISAYLKNTVR